jgi:hypothetical protein
MEDVDEKARGRPNRRPTRSSPRRRRTRSAGRREDARFDMSGIVRPAGPMPSPLYLHLRRGRYLTAPATSPPRSSSPVKRLANREVKLSEMWFVYWEYVAKARGFVASRGSTASRRLAVGVRDLGHAPARRFR